MPKELTIYTGTIHKFAIISNHDQQPIDRSINLLHSPVVITRRGRIVKWLLLAAPAAPCCSCLLLSVLSTLLVVSSLRFHSVRLGSPCDWQAKMRCCLLEIDWQQHGQALLVPGLVRRCCNEQCLHYKAQCVNAMHACACPDTVPVSRSQTDRARTHAAAHARNQRLQG